MGARLEASYQEQGKSDQEHPQELKGQFSVGNEAEVVGVIRIDNVVRVNEGDGSTLSGSRCHFDRVWGGEIQPDEEENHPED